jgi:DDE domain
MSVRFHHWELGFGQSSFRHIARALQDVAFSVFQRLPLLRHALFPSGFRLQVNRTAQRYFLRTSPDCVRDSAARSAAHSFPAARSGLLNALYGGRGTTARALCSFDLRVQLPMTVRDTKAAKRFFRKMFKLPQHPSPRVINVDQNRSYPPAVEELKEEGVLSIATQLRRCKNLNNIVEQDHRFIKAPGQSRTRLLQFQHGSADHRWL